MRALVPPPTLDTPETNPEYSPLSPYTEEGDRQRFDG